MYWILLVMGLIVSIVAAVLVGGFFTPRKHVAARYIDLKAAPDVVWKLVRTVTEYPNWREDIRKVEMIAGNDSRPSWTEFGLSKSTSYRAEVDDAPSRLTTRILDEDLGYSGEWRFVISPIAGGTRLTITEDGEVNNPVFRFFGNFIGYTRTIDKYLNDLAAELREDAKPQSATA